MNPAAATTNPTVDTTIPLTLEQMQLFMQNLRFSAPRWPIVGSSDAPKWDPTKVSQIKAFRYRIEDLAIQYGNKLDEVYSKFILYIPHDERDKYRSIPEFMAAQLVDGRIQTSEERWESFWKKAMGPRGLRPECTLDDLYKIVQKEDEDFSTFLGRFEKVANKMSIAEKASRQSALLNALTPQMRQATMPLLKSDDYDGIVAACYEGEQLVELWKRITRQNPANEDETREQAAEKRRREEEMNEMRRQLAAMSAQLQAAVGRQSVGASTGGGGATREGTGFVRRCLYCDSIEHVRAACVDFAAALRDGKVELREGKMFFAGGNDLVPLNIGRGGSKVLVEEHTMRDATPRVSFVTVCAKSASLGKQEVDVDAAKRKGEEMGGSSSSSAPKKQATGERQPAIPIETLINDDVIMEIEDEPEVVSRDKGKGTAKGTRKKKDEGKPKYRYEAEIDKEVSEATIVSKILKTEVPKVTVGELLAGMPVLRNALTDRMKKRCVMTDMATGQTYETDVTYNFDEILEEDESGIMSFNVGERTKRVYATAVRKSYQELVAAGSINLKASFGEGQRLECLVDEGSEINVVSESVAIANGFQVDTNIRWTMNGVAGSDELIGIAPSVTVMVGGISRVCAVFVSRALQISAILGRPWAISVNLVTDNRLGVTKVTLRDNPDDPYAKQVQIIVQTLKNERHRFLRRDEGEFEDEEGSEPLQYDKNRRVVTFDTQAEVKSIKLGKEEVIIKGRELMHRGQTYELEDNEELAAMADFLLGRVQQ